MRKLALVLLLMPAVCFSQQISVGFQIGNNYNSAFGKDIYNPYIKMGYGIHTLIKAEISDNLSIMAEPGYNQLGFAIKFVDRSDLFWTYHREYHYKFDAATLPITFVYSRGRDIKFQALGGAYVQYVFNGSVDWHDEGVMFKRTQYMKDGQSDISNFTQGFDFGVCAGVGIAVDVTKYHRNAPITVFGNIRQFYGLKKTFSPEITSIDGYDFYREAHLTSFQFRVGLTIGL